MAVMNPAPEGFNSLVPYLPLNDAAGFIEFAQAALGAEVKMREEAGGLVRHAQLRIGSSMIMLCDAMEGFPAQPAQLFTFVEDADAAHAKALEHGATELMPPAEQDYGRSSGVKDAWGNTWWLTQPPAGQ